MLDKINVARQSLLQNSLKYRELVARTARKRKELAQK